MVLCFEHPKRALFLSAVIFVLLLPLYDLFGEVFELFLLKSERVGVNMRFEELRAVWGAISVHPLSVLFGLGWGAHFSSPAVADIDVQFTHGLLSSALLKTGIIGLLLHAAFIISLLKMLCVHFRKHVVFAVALGGPVLIDVFLYASFKSLDFGLVLMLIPALVSYARFLEDQTLQNIDQKEPML